MILRTLRVSAALGHDGPERCELGPDPRAALAAAKAEPGPVVFVLCNDDLAQLDECRELIVDRGRKHPAKPLASLLLGQAKIPLIRGGHTSPGQLLRSLRALLDRAVAAGDGNAFLVGADAAAFSELWDRAAAPAGRSSTAPPGELPRPAQPGAQRARSGLFALLLELPIPASVRERFRGDSPEARLVLQLILRAARQNEPVLILGDTGTGKEVVARLIHDESPRRLQNFTAVNCGAIPRELLESELFGYVKGAHSTAKARKLGLWEQASGGTLFLDEIADLSLAHQVKILRALEHGEIRPVGAERETKVDARVVVATNRDLFGMMQAGEFREDLYYRLRSFMIRTPALRDHPEDIPALARHFWKSVSRRQDAELPEQIVAELARYRWPGNARELRMVLSSLFALFGAEDLGVQHLRAVFEFEGQAASAGASGPSRPADATELALHRVECLRHLRRANELVRAVQVALRPLLRGRELDREALAPVLEQRVSELELLCLQPLLFHGEFAFSIVRRVKDELHALAESLRGDPPEPPAQWRQEFEGDSDLALSTLFKEVDKLLEAAARGD